MLLGTKYSIRARSRSVRNAADTKDFSAFALEKSRQLVDFSAWRFRNGPALECFVPEQHAESVSQIPIYI